MGLPLTSVNGDVKWKTIQVEHARGWNISPKNVATTYTTNKTKGKVSRRPGNYDVTGQFTIYSTDGDVPFLPGQIGRLQLYPDSGGQPWDLQDAIILDTPLEVDIETNKIIGVTVQYAFAGKDDATGGSITTPNGDPIDSTTPDL